MFCDSDDYVEPKWCEWLYNAIKIDNVYLALCGVECIQSENLKRYKGVSKEKMVSRHEFIEMIPEVNLYELWNKIYIASVVRENGLYFDEKITRCEDALFTMKYLKLMGESKKICYGSPALYHYFVNTSGSLTKQYVKNYAMIQKELLSNLLSVFEEFGICQKQYIEYYSVKAAYACSNVIANCFVKNNSETLLMKHKEIFKLVKSQEYQVALRYGGMRQVAEGMYLSVLYKKSSILIFIYHYLHMIKFKLQKKSGGLF